MNRNLAVFLAAVLLAGCSSITSTRDPKIEGLTYYLPTKYVTVSLIVNAKGERTVVIGTSDALPDLSQRYVARFNASQIGTNKLTIKTTAAGLLTGESTTSSVSSLTDIFKALAGMYGQMPVLASAGPHEPCTASSLFLWTYDATDSRQLKGAEDDYGPELCNLKIDIVRLPSTHDDATETNVAGHNGAKKNHAEAGSASGFYYRRAVPYLVRVFDNAGPRSRHGAT